VLVHADAIVQSDRAAGETTCVIVVVSNDGRIVGASAGDSGATVVSTDGNIDDLTERQHRKGRLRSALDGTLVVGTTGCGPRSSQMSSASMRGSMRLRRLSWGLSGFPAVGCGLM